MPISDKTIAIVGLGMLGSSLAERLKREESCKKILGYARRSETVEDALKRQVIDAGGTDAATIISQADIVILATPIPVTIDFVEKHADHFKDGAIVSDIGSIKTKIVTGCRKALQGRNVTFIGGHPMAGSEKSGLKSRKIDMYSGAVIFLTPENDEPVEAIREVKAIWEAVGGRVELINKELHDEVVAYASQSLHVVASAAARAVLGGEDGELCAQASAGGFRDLTRIASSNPIMWREILENNKAGNVIAMEAIIDQMNQALELLKNDKWDKLQAYLAEGKAMRDDCLSKK